MSYTRLTQDDILLTAESVAQPAWTGNTPTLSTFATSSVQQVSSTGQFYLTVYQTGSNQPNAEPQFDISYGNKYGSGSFLYNLAVDGQSPTRSVYGQFRTLVNGDENTDFLFGNYTSSAFIALTLPRARYKKSIFPGSLTLGLTEGSNILTLTDDSKTVTTIQYKDSGRVYQLVSGSGGNIYTGLNSNGWTVSGSYGWVLPDIGVILLNPNAITLPVAAGGLNTSFSTGSNTQNTVLAKTYNLISASFGVTLLSEETVTSNIVYIRAKSSEYNYSENPSFTSGSTGEVLYPSFITNPKTYYTTIGLYNDNNELLAVAKMSRPMKKDFVEQTLVRVKLSY